MPTACERTRTSSGPIAGGSRSTTSARSGASKTSAFISQPFVRASMELHSAGHVHALARHVPGALGSKEGDHLADVLGLLRATERDSVDELLPRLIARDALGVRELTQQRLPEWRADDSGAHGVDPDVVRSELL